MISMISLGNIVITEFTNAELYRDLNTDKDVLYFAGIAEIDDSDKNQKRILGRVPDFGTRYHCPINDRDKCIFPVKKEYEDAIGVSYNNEELLYTLEQLSSVTLGIDEINNKELLDNVSIVKTKWLPTKPGDDYETYIHSNNVVITIDNKE